jgi:hypothetical protein
LAAVEEAFQNFYPVFEFFYFSLLFSQKVSLKEFCEVRYIFVCEKKFWVREEEVMVLLFFLFEFILCCVKG